MEVGNCMTLGRKSLTAVITVNDIDITIQANKNYGICDMSPRINEVLSDFQGQQMLCQEDGKLYLNDTVLSKVEASLNRIINSED